jgi:hypothetical protein
LSPSVKSLRERDESRDRESVKKPMTQPEDGEYDYEIKTTTSKKDNKEQE